MAADAERRGARALPRRSLAHFPRDKSRPLVERAFPRGNASSTNYFPVTTLDPRVSTALGSPLHCDDSRLPRDDSRFRLLRRASIKTNGRHVEQPAGWWNAAEADLRQRNQGHAAGGGGGGGSSGRRTGDCEATPATGGTPPPRRRIDENAGENAGENARPGRKPSVLARQYAGVLAASEYWRAPGARTHTGPLPRGAGVRVAPMSGPDQAIASRAAPWAHG